MKDYLLTAMILLLLAIIFIKLDILQTRSDDINDAIIGSSEAVITEFYRYRGD